jgi:hypothetical protein
MKSLPYEKNWFNKINECIKLYGKVMSEGDVEDMDCAVFKAGINKKIRSFVFEELKVECGTKMKTKNLSYQAYEMQDYLRKLPPKELYLAIKIRCSMLDTIHDRPYLARGIQRCRLCEIGDESLSHIVNCYAVSDKVQEVCSSIYGCDIDIDALK